MRRPASILSVGIDIGTTTTHLTVSELELANVSPGNQVPQVGISSRKIAYQSKVHLTPLTADGAINGEAVAAIIASEYAAAKIRPADISTGAVIITGESARRRNAREVVDAISSFAGDFVVASAGPHLESLLAGRGSGAARAAADTLKTICNVDIGGGTTNVAVFSGERLLDTACLNIGGRCLQFRQDGTMAVSEFGQIILAALGSAEWSAGYGGNAVTDSHADPRAVDHPSNCKSIDAASLQRIGKLLSEAIVGFIAGKSLQPVPPLLLATEALRHDYHIDEYWFSGGVAELMANPNPGGDRLLYGDIGVCLAEGILASLQERELVFHIPEHPIRATVIGAGAHSMQLSGTTISIDSNTLPLKNLQIIRPFVARASGDETIPLDQFVCQSINSGLLNYDIDWRQQAVALQLESIAEPNFATLNAWAAALAGAFVTLRAKPPLVIICAQDIAMALGQLLKQTLPAADLVVIDGIQTSTGDYIDIGKPLTNHQSLPVIIKDLIFSS